MNNKNISEVFHNQEVGAIDEVKYSTKGEIILPEREVFHIDSRQAQGRQAELNKPSLLTLSSYKPDFRQKRVVLKVQAALHHFLPYFRERKMELSQKLLEQYFGSHQNKMYNWMRSRLLKYERGYHVTAGRAITYTINQDGFSKLWCIVFNQGTFDYSVERANQLRPVFEPYISGQEKLPLHQTADGGRIYGPHQQLEKSVRRVLLAGMFDYDIQAAMPTLVLQNIGADWQERFPLWRKYLGNRKHFREALAEDYSISIGDAKELFQGLFSQAVFNGSKFGIGKVLSAPKLQRAMKDPWIWGLYQEARSAWATFGTKTGSPKGPARFFIYEKLEQQVMYALYEHLSSTGVRFWPFHDGFTVLDARADVGTLQEAVKVATCYSIILDEEQL